MQIFLVFGSKTVFDVIWDISMFSTYFYLHAFTEKSRMGIKEKWGKMCVNLDFKENFDKDPAL